MFPTLNLPKYNIKIRTNDEDAHTFIFDDVRRKYVVLTPEEWVRQHFIHYLADSKGYPLSLMAVEKQLDYNDLKKRSDLVVFNSESKAQIIVECKSPKVKITQDAFDQVALYNLKHKANYLCVTNGMEHYYCSLNYGLNSYSFLKDLPHYKKKK